MKKLGTSFLHAIHGIAFCIRHETNAKIHLFMTALVISMGCYFTLSSNEWMIILVCIGMVTGMELINTAVESLCNAVHPEKSEKIRIVKDTAAGAVLVTACIAAICGLIIFIPKIIYFIYTV